MRPSDFAQTGQPHPFQKVIREFGRLVGPICLNPDERKLRLLCPHRREQAPTQFTPFGSGLRTAIGVRHRLLAAPEPLRLRAVQTVIE